MSSYQIKSAEPSRPSYLQCTGAFCTPFLFTTTPKVCLNRVALQSLGANHVLVIFEEEGLALFLYRNEADQHHVVRQMISRQFKEKPFRVCYCDVQMRIPMTTPEIVCLTSISSDKFTMGDFDDRWSEMTLKQMMSFRRSNALV